MFFLSDYFCIIGFLNSKTKIYFNTFIRNFFVHIYSHVTIFSVHIMRTSDLFKFVSFEFSKEIGLYKAPIFSNQLKISIKN